MEGVLYCKPHFEQLFKETGNFSTKFPASGDIFFAKAPSKVSSMFSGTQDKCASCNKTAYPLEKISVEGEIYHKTCFRCFHGGCTLTPSSYAALDGVLYCKHHFAQLFKEKGSYDHLTQVAMKRKSEDSPALEEAAATVAAEAAEEQGKPDEEQS
ncbi:hypothetical protein ZIOFF_053146 [Zingiber officinale]|uniref:LIM zinc-binding domain-containing protein n=1 Tax=Zingiber officinale TaxID=94328 RepID=A0A8J5KPP6_ZINOF|nr:hypothetical protein ZIOFF_053146 [Zingiber officinale]